MTADELKAARVALGLTQDQLAARLELTGDNPGATVRAWEKGRRPVSGPAAVAVRYMLKFGELDEGKTNGD